MCYGTKTRLITINIPFSIGGALTLYILFYLKAHQAFAENPQLFLW
jgi:hypothetical protein